VFVLRRWSFVNHVNDMINDTEALSTIVGARVVAAEPCRWGFENRTAIATLEDGRRLVVQRINSRAWAGYKLHLARVLPDRLSAVGVRAPRLLSADAAADPPYAVREYLPGESAASLMGTVGGAIQVARAMGALLPQLALVATSGAGLSDAWASPASLAREAQQRFQPACFARRCGDAIGRGHHHRPVPARQPGALEIREGHLLAEVQPRAQGPVQFRPLAYDSGVIESRHF